MANVTNQVLKGYFETGKTITQQKMHDLIDSKGREYVSEAVAVDANGKFRPTPDRDKYIDLIDQSVVGGPIEIGLDTSARVPNTFIRVMLLTNGVNAVTFSPDFPQNKRIGSIDSTKVKLYVIWLNYISEDKKFAQILELPPIDDSAPLPTFTPAQGEVLTDLSGNLIIDWDEAVRNTDLREIVDDSVTPSSNQINVGDLITLKVTDANGADVPFTATINQSKNQFVVNPDSNLTEDQQYYLAVGPVENYSGYEMTAAESITFTSTAGALTTPTNLTANTISTSQIDVSWDNVANEQGYELQASQDQTNWSVIATTATDVTSFSHTGLGPGETWYYRVKALGDGTTNTDSDWSTTAQATTQAETLTTPTNFTATATDDNKINLTWDDVANETGYEIERSGDGGTTYNPLATVGAGVTEYLDESGLSPSTEYYYRVRAQGDGVSYVDSAWAEAFDTTLAEDTTAPTVTGVEIKNETPAKMHVTYSEPVDATTAGYNVDTDSATALNITAVASGNGTSVVVFQLDRAVEDTETLNLDYDATTGDTTDDSSNNNPLASFTDTAITNNVTAFTPADVSEFWAAARLETGYTDGQNLDPITNQVTGGTNAIAISPAVYRAGAFAGGTQPAYEADGVDDEYNFQTAYEAEVFQTSKWGFVFVEKTLLLDDSSQGYLGVGKGDTGDFELSTGTGYWHYVKTSANDQNGETHGTIDGNENIITYIFDWDTDEIIKRKNGVEISRQTGITWIIPADMTFTDTLKLFAVKGGEFANRQLAEFAFGNFGETDAIKVEDYFNGIYSIY